MSVGNNNDWLMQAMSDGSVQITLIGNDGTRAITSLQPEGVGALFAAIMAAFRGAHLMSGRPTPGPQDYQPVAPIEPDRLDVQQRAGKAFLVVQVGAADFALKLEHLPTEGLGRALMMLSGTAYPQH